MSYFDQILKKIFANRTSLVNDYVKQILKRSPKDKQAYQKWLSSDQHKEFITAIAQAYFYKKADIVSSIQVHLFKSNGANGFAISYHPNFGKKKFQHLLDYFKERVQTLNYHLQVAERKITDRGDYVETKDKYYLKPSIRLGTINQGLCNQLYGNILLEHISVDNRPSYIKVLVTYYNDHLFAKALDYDDFIEELFAERNS